MKLFRMMRTLGMITAEVRHVSGALATSYARIRYGGGDDAKRTSRQRIVINLMVQKLKQNPTKIPEILDKVMGNVSTSLTKNEILELGMHAVTYTMGTSYAYPFQLCYGENVVNALGEDVVIPVTLEFNVKELHAYLYPESFDMNRLRLLQSTATTLQERAVTMKI